MAQQQESKDARGENRRQNPKGPANKQDFVSSLSFRNHHPADSRRSPPPGKDANRDCKKDRQNLALGNRAQIQDADKPVKTIKDGPEINKAPGRSEQGKQPRDRKQKQRNQQ